MTKAYADAGMVPLGQSLSALQQSDGLDRLNDLINLWQTQGLKLFLETETQVPLTAGQQMYSFMPSGSISMARPLQVKEAAYWDQYGNVRPLVPMARADWTIISNRTTQGSVSQYFAEKLYDRLNLYLWNVPDSTAAQGYVTAVLRNQATNPATVGLATNFPPEWFIALRWGLADDLATNQPEAVQRRCATKAATFMSALENWDVEDAPTQFVPDDRGLGASSFR
jgi:hypothetical protein